MPINTTVPFRSWYSTAYYYVFNWSFFFFIIIIVGRGRGLDLCFTFFDSFSRSWWKNKKPVYNYEYVTGGKKNKFKKRAISEKKIIKFIFYDCNTIIIKRKTWFIWVGEKVVYFFRIFNFSFFLFFLRVAVFPPLPTPSNHLSPYTFLISRHRFRGVLRKTIIYNCKLNYEKKIH